MRTMTNSLLLALAAATTLAASPAAQAELAVIVHPKNPVSKMNAEEASQYFIGKSAALKAADYPAGTALKSDFYAKVLQKEPGQVKAIWMKLVFTGKGTAPREYASAAELKRAVAADVNAIGYIDKASADDSVKIVLTAP